MVIRLPNKPLGGEDRYAQPAGQARGHFAMTRVVEVLLSDLDFDPGTGLAKSYTPMQDGGVKIVLDPHRRFGEPIVEPSGYTARTLRDATITEGGIDAAAEAYDVTAAEVRLADRYCDSITPTWIS